MKETNYLAFYTLVVILAALVFGGEMPRLRSLRARYQGFATTHHRVPTG